MIAGRKNPIKWLYVFWVLAIGCIVVITFSYQGEFTKFYGIAETQEINVSCERSGEIKRIYVVPGQHISQGEPMVELYSPKLATAINEVTHDLEIMKTQTQRNQVLFQSLECFAEDTTLETVSPLKDTLQISVDMLEHKLALLLEDQKKHFMTAPITGVVGAVRCKPSEMISSYESILTLQAISPTYVRGYVHEFAYTRITVGQQVRVLSLADPKNRTVGEVIGVSSKIVEYPGRLKKMLELQVYGREVQIKIPDDNPFIMGEKLLIDSQQNPNRLAKWIKALISRFPPSEKNKATIPAPSTKGVAL